MAFALGAKSIGPCSDRRGRDHRASLFSAFGTSVSGGVKWTKYDHKSASLFSPDFAVERVHGHLSSWPQGIFKLKRLLRFGTTNLLARPLRRPSLAQSHKDGCCAVYLLFGIEYIVRSWIRMLSQPDISFV